MATIRRIENVEDYNKLVAGTCVIKVSAAWCHPCHTLSETIKNLDTKITFAELDADDEFSEDITSNLGIRGIPVLIFFKDGQEVGRTVGAVGSDVIYNNLKNLE